MHAQRDIVSAAPSVRLSVCLSNAGSVSKWIDISSHFGHHYDIILVFEHHSRYKNSNGTPLAAALNPRGWENFGVYPETRDRSVVSVDH